MITSRNIFTRNWFVSFIIVLGIFVGIIWANLRFVENGFFSPDFYKYYRSTRTFIMEGVSPYNSSISKDIQQEIYGRAAKPSEDPFVVSYPFYANVIFIPFALVSNFVWAQTLWIIFLEFALVLIAFLSLRLAKWQPSLWLLPFYFVFTLFWFHGFEPFRNGNMIIIVAILFLAAMVAMRNQQDITAGLLLALMTIMPLISIPLILFVILWSIFHRRLTLIGWFFGGCLILIVFGMLFIPDWLIQYGWNLFSLPNQTPSWSLGAAFEDWWPGIGTQLRWGLTIFLTGLLIFEGWATWGKDYDRFLWTASLTLTLSPWIGIAVDPENLIILSLPLVIVFSIIKERWGKTGDWIVFGIMMAFFVGLWALYYQKLIINQVHPAIMSIPLPLFLIIGLYWTRWWVLRPTRGIGDG